MKRSRALGCRLRWLAMMVVAGGLLVPARARPGSQAWNRHKTRQVQALPPTTTDNAPRRVANRSPRFPVSESDIALHINYSGLVPSTEEGGEPEKFHHLEIGRKAMEMIEAAEERIVVSVFLFDSIYVEGFETPIDLVKQFTDLLLRKRRENPDLQVAVIFDPTHKAYGQRMSPAEARFREHGIDVFYSDLLEDLKKGSLFGVREASGHVSRMIDRLTGNRVGEGASEVFGHAKVPVPLELDGEKVSAEMVYNALLLKANHRKLMVTDVHGEDYEALISSANPHNPSALSENNAITVRGDLARYIHDVLREDIRQCLSLGARYAHLHDGADPAYADALLRDRLPRLYAASGSDRADQADRSDREPAGVTFVSEGRIVEAVLDRLKAVEAKDEIRIQMFYLSYQPVIDALVDASRKTLAPVKILLDPNKDAFGLEKDGTPNRQVAHFMMKQRKKGARLEIRWYATHGEQNHTKTMSITHPDARRCWLTVGSCNWTGRNMAGVNMEANVIVDGAPWMNARFDESFDLFWGNTDGNLYSVEYEVFSDHAGYWKWRRGERPFYYSSF